MGLPVIASIYAGQPKTLVDDRGEWVSSIRRDRVEGPAEIGVYGLLGDKVAQPYHGGPDAAICVHLRDHYDFWREKFGLSLNCGGLGENFVLDGIKENEIFVGDIVRAGTALVQVSGPRVPCANQARHVGRSDWVRLTIRENRTGFYLRVLEKGSAQASDLWQLQERLNSIGSIPQINRCLYLEFDRELAKELAALNGLADWWKGQFRERLESKKEHWSETLTE